MLEILLFYHLESCDILSGKSYNRKSQKRYICLQCTHPMPRLLANLAHLAILATALASSALPGSSETLRGFTSCQTTSRNGQLPNSSCSFFPSDPTAATGPLALEHALHLTRFLTGEPSLPVHVLASNEFHLPMTTDSAHVFAANASGLEHVLAAHYTTWGQDLHASPGQGLMARLKAEPCPSIPCSCPVGWQRIPNLFLCPQNSTQCTYRVKNLCLPYWPCPPNTEPQTSGSDQCVACKAGKFRKTGPWCVAMSAEEVAVLERDGVRSVWDRGWAHKVETMDTKLHEELSRPGAVAVPVERNGLRDTSRHHVWLVRDAKAQAKHFLLDQPETMLWDIWTIVVLTVLSAAYGTYAVRSTRGARTRVYPEDDKKVHFMEVPQTHLFDKIVTVEKPEEKSQVMKFLFWWRRLI